MSFPYRAPGTVASRFPSGRNLAPILAPMGTSEAEPGEAGSAAPDGAAAERNRMRRRPLGYRQADVDMALAARDAELAELRRDVAALWLAFAQHDRMIRAVIAPPERGDGPDRGGEAAAGALDLPEGGAGDTGTQLSDLDQVLAAIETATRTLERTYSEEVGEGPVDSGAAEADSQAGAESAPDARERPGREPES